MAKTIDFGMEAFNKLKAGAEKLNNAVGITMGAKGRNVLLEGLYESDAPHITKDGITVAKAVQLKDPVERIASNLMKKVALETNNVVGDGSTTSICLGNSILRRGADILSEGGNSVMLKRGIDIELKNTLEYLDAMNTPLKGDMDMAYQVALVSANGDAEVAKLITEVYTQVGENGNIAIEPDIHSPDLSYQKVEGLEFDRGFNHPYFITDIPTETVEYSNPVYIISDYKVMSIFELKKVLELCQSLSRPVVLICEELEPDVNNKLAVNKLNNALQIVSINAPEFGDRRLEFLEDLAILTGGKFISTITNKTFDDVTVDDLGESTRVIVTRNDTAIIGGKGNEKEIQERLEGIQKQIETTKDRDHKKYLERRYAKLRGGVVVIKVGGYSDVERAEIKDRVEDAVNAVKTALKGGIIPGGGTPLLRISMLPLVKNENEEEDITKGRKVLKDAIRAPFIQIMKNAGYENEEVLKLTIEDLIKSESDIVFNVMTGSFVNGIEDGIIDPVLVTKTALINAASIAGTLLTTGCTISFEPDGDTTLKL